MRNPFRGEHIYHEKKKRKKIFAKPNICTPRCHAHAESYFSNFVVEYRIFMVILCIWLGPYKFFYV